MALVIGKWQDDTSEGKGVRLWTLTLPSYTQFLRYLLHTDSCDSPPFDMQSDTCPVCLSDDIIGRLRQPERR